MKRLIATGAALALLAVPAGAMAKPTKTDRSNAAKECRAERGSTVFTREAFRAKYGTNKKGKNAFGKCVSRQSRDEQRERAAARSNAAKECKAERALDANAFALKYGTNGKANGHAKGKNAYGKCVSQKAKENKKKADEADAVRISERKSAAKDCAAERTTIGREAFAAKYGTNRNKRNAFGKCVSTTAKAKHHTES